jgi:hypothetical protein
VHLSVSTSSSLTTPKRLNKTWIASSRPSKSISVGSGSTSSSASKRTPGMTPSDRGDLLLRSPILEDAEHWILSRPRDAVPPTPESHAFVVESRRSTARGPRRHQFYC